MKSFILNLQFLTRIPIGDNIQYDQEEISKGTFWFPLIGLIVGLLCFGVYYIASQLFFGFFPVLCCIVANVVITGALHIDGLADTCDGIFSTRSKDRMLEIMKDSRIGTNGVIAIAFDLLFRITLISQMSIKQAALSIILAPVISRTMLVGLIYFSKYARANGGMGSIFMNKKYKINTYIGVGIGLAISIIAMGKYGLYVFMICIIMNIFYKTYIDGKIGGMTGDTLGAANELTEIVFFIVIVFWGGKGLI